MNKCLLCKMASKTPVRLYRCSHVFCEGCLLKKLVSSLICPAQGCDLSSRHYLRLTDQYVDRHYATAAVNIKRYYGTNRVKGDQTGWDPRLTDYERITLEDCWVCSRDDSREATTQKSSYSDDHRFRRVCRLCNIQTIHFECLAKQGEVEPRLWFCDDCKGKVREFKRERDRKKNK